MVSHYNTLKKIYGPSKRWLEENHQKIISYLQTKDLEEAQEKKLRELHNRFYASIEKVNKLIIEITKSVATDEEQTNWDAELTKMAELMITYETTLALSTTTIKGFTEDHLVKREGTLLNNTSERSEKVEVRRNENERNVRLPKIDLPKFSGAITEFSEFWDSFCSSVHNNNNLKEHQKLHYLQSLLTNEAARAIAGLKLDDKSYFTALEILERRFGNKANLIEAHYLDIQNIKINKNTINELREKFDKVEYNLRILEKLGQDCNQNILKSIVFMKLPDELKTYIKDKINYEESKLDDIRSLIQKYIRDRTFSEFEKEKDKIFNKRVNMVYEKKANTHDRKFWCAFCQQPHYSSECHIYKTHQERKQKIKGRCFNCLGENHTRNNCKIQKCCYYCKQKNKHHSSLCDKQFPEMQVENKTAVNLTTEGRVILPTISVIAKDLEETNFTTINVLLDSASDFSYCSTNLFDKLKLKKIGKSQVNLSLFSESVPKKVSVINSQLLLCKNNVQMLINVHVIPSICSIPTLQVKKNREKLCNEYNYVDSTEIDVLIGAEIYNEIIKGVKERRGGLYVLETIFGEVITGKYLNDKSIKFSDAQHLEMNNFSNNEELNNDQRMFDYLVNSDSFGALEYEQSEESIVEYFYNTIEYHNLRYTVRFPWKDSLRPNNNNYNISYHRLISLIKRNQQNSGDDTKSYLKVGHPYLKAYNDIIEEQVQLGIIERVASKEKEGYYMPHHGVLKDTASTKLRIVYDASSKNKACLSLNDCLHKGPKLLSDLCSLLFKIRLHRILLLADIEKAFLQVGLHEEDRKFTKFLWVDDITAPPSRDRIITFQFRRLPFGTVSSPYLLMMTLHYHTEKNYEEYLELVKGHIYMDNFIKAVDTIEEAEKTIIKMKEICYTAGMNMRDWIITDEKLNESYGSTLESSQVKLLGYYYDVAGDQLAVIIPGGESEVSTRREATRYIGSYFDPLGMIAPVVILYKQFLHGIVKNTWDENIGPEALKSWKKLTSEMGQSKMIRFPRLIGPFDKNGMIVGFVDANKTSYGCCFYLKRNDEVNLIYAKVRLIPKNTMTIPRAELLAAWLGASVLDYLRSFMKWEMRTVIYSDSLCTLHWLKTRKILTTFVRNRVDFINTVVNIEWRYVNSQENIADLLTKGCLLNKIQERNTWWHGPLWLAKDCDAWPSWQTSYDEKYLTEVKRNNKSVFNNIQVKSINSPFEIEIENYSSYIKLLRVTGFCLKFIDRLKHKKIYNFSQYVEQSRLMWVQAVQNYDFKDEIKLLKKGKSNKTIAFYDLFLDELNILRCNSRLKYANVDYAIRYPVLLSNKAWLTSLIILNIHLENAHCGENHTLCVLRNNYWIAKARRTVKRVIGNCSLCRKIKSRPYNIPKPPDLPPYRVNPAVPFEYVGIDYAGPIIINYSGKSRKVYVVLFTCMCVRAIHLEVVKGLDTTSFMNCFERFVARRGAPAVVFSDNATYFQLFHKLIKQIPYNIKQDLSKLLEEENIFRYKTTSINWKFLPPKAPWMGGFYERLIGIMKNTLTKVLVDRRITNFDAFKTIICEVERVVNNRPLYSYYDDIELTYITPSDFICANNNKFESKTMKGLTADDEEYNIQSNLKGLMKIFKKEKEKVRQFFQIFRKEYVESLRTRTQAIFPKEGERIPRINDVVIIYDDIKSKLDWDLGVVKDLITSNDGRVRSAILKVKNKGNLTRPIKKLYYLESQEDPDIKELVSNRPLGNVGNIPMEPIIDNHTHQERLP